jgi:hypothetical protein
MNQSLHIVALACATFFSTGCKEKDADATPSGVTSPARTISSVSETEPVPTASATAPASVAAASPAESDDCLSRCRAFTKRRGECVDLFTKDLTPPAMRAEVIADHRKTADGHECREMCTELGRRMVENQKRWGACASGATCEAFVACFKAGNK